LSTDNQHNKMDPISGEQVEVEGVYRNEWGREEKMERGQMFPSDPMLGNTEWELVELDFDNHHKGHTDPRLVPHDDDDNPEAHMQHPRRHPEDTRTEK
jgi:hypothetical protein